jgi:hypothetical protein
MKRYVCTVATGLLLALVSTGSAAAGLPLLGDTQQGSQSTSFGDQSVGEQKNDADVNQAQGNGNVNVSPAIAIFGDATTWNAQGNGNTARADVDQSNTATQSQDSRQNQDLEQSGSKGKGHCCGGQSQTGEQSTDFGDQTVDKQKNEAEVNQYQGNGNLNISPAIAIGGHESSCSSRCGGDRKHGGASTFNAQGNGNVAKAGVDQSNVVTQSQSASQTQGLGQSGGSCCKPRGGWKPPENGCTPMNRPGGKPSCCDGRDQTGSQSASFGDQTVGEQRNDADATQEQGNKNANVSPALGTGGKKQHRSCGHVKNGKAGDGGASTWSAQGNGNVAQADVDQGNTVDQSQASLQDQGLSQNGEGVSLL